MHLSSFVTFVTCALGVSGAAHQLQRRALKEDPVPKNAKNLPGYTTLNPDWVGQMYPFSAWKPSLIKFFPVPYKDDDSCSTYITLDNSGCTGSRRRYGGIVQPILQSSKKHFEFEYGAKITKGDYYDKGHVNITGKFQGRIFVTDSLQEPAAKDRTGIKGFRFFSNPGQTCIWLENDPDEETGQNRTVVAPWSNYFFSSTPTANRGELDLSKPGGYKASKICTNEPHNQLYLQLC